MGVFFHNKRVRIILAAALCLFLIFLITTAINAYAPHGV